MLLQVFLDNGKLSCVWYDLPVCLVLPQQVQYSLLYRRPETNGVFEACKEAGVTMVAYSPLCQGLLTGMWQATNARGRDGDTLQPCTGAETETERPFMQERRAVADKDWQLASFSPA
jgi:aryl-alcohol dehydrogenase-like predicted oxidoreductase